MQVLRPDPNAQYRNIVHAFYKIVSTEGPLRTVRGINATLYGAGPAHALYFAAYEKLKTLLSKHTKQNALTPGLLGSIFHVVEAFSRCLFNGCEGAFFFIKFYCFQKCYSYDYFTSK